MSESNVSVNDFGASPTQDAATNTAAIESAIENVTVRVRLAPETIASVRLAQRPNIAENTQFLIVTKTYPPSFKRIKSDRIDVTPALTIQAQDGAFPTLQSPVKTPDEMRELKRKSLSANKRLLEDKGLDAIVAADTAALFKVAALCLPSPIRATRLIPNRNIIQAEEILTAHAIERTKLVQTWISSGSYMRAILEAEQRLTPLGLFDQRDYIPSLVIAQEFKFEWNYVKLGVSDGLKEINATLWEREKEKTAAKWREAGEEIQMMLRVSFQDLLEHVNDCLTPTEDGKQKRLRKEAMQNINDFLASFEARNITNDEDLAKVVSKVRDLTSGISAKDIRTNEAIRDGIKLGFAEVKASLNTMIENVPRRRVTFEE